MTSLDRRQFLFSAAAASASSEPVYRTASYTVTRDTVVEGARRAEAHTDGPWPYLVNARRELVRPFPRGEYPSVTSSAPLLDVLYRVALADLEMNVIDGKHFRVSPDFHPRMLFTRDTAYASYLGAAYVMPEIVESHLRVDRELRRKLAFRCSQGLSLPLPGIHNQEENLSNNEFFEKYGTHAYGRRTDDVCWAAGFWEALCARPSEASLRWMADEFEYFDREFYAKFFDPRDGLYRGQASFIDVGGTGYPEDYGPVDSILIKALSTNCLYAGAFDRLAQASRRLGRAAAAHQYAKRSRELKEAIRREFHHPDGYYAYFKNRQGALEPRREQLGTAFLALFDVLPAGEAARALAGYPANDYGSPVFWPFYEFNGKKAKAGLPHGDAPPGFQKVYHNNAIWPFADTLLQLACLKAAPSEDVLLRTFGRLARHAFNGNFAEVQDYETGGARVQHARSYIWSAAAFLAFVFRMLAGLDLEDPEHAGFRPFLPRAFGGKLAIRGLRAGAMRLNVEIEGGGNEVKSVTIDGKPRPAPTLRRDAQEHHLRIRLI